MKRLGIVRLGKLEFVKGEAVSVVEKIAAYGTKYPDYLTPREMEVANESLAYFDRLAMEIKTAREMAA